MIRRVGTSSPAVAPDARRWRRALAALLVALLAACHTIPKHETPPENVSHLPPGNSTRDGPEANPPPNLASVPDAVPQVEPLRIGGPNKPYEVAGHTYVPLTDDRPVTEKGLASWYGKKFHGHRTASGEAYNMYAMTAAHKTLPIPSYARVRNPANGREVIVRVNDRGPFSAGRVIDLSYTAALKLGVLGGVQQVEISRITEDDIRTGAAFRRSPAYAGDTPPPTATPAAATATATATATASTGGPPPMPGPTSIAVGDLDRPAAVTPPGTRSGAFAARRTKASGAPGDGATLLAPSSADVLATAADPSRATAGPGRAVPAAGAVGAGLTGATVDLGAAAAADSAADIAGVTTSVTTEVLPAGARVAVGTAAAVPARSAWPALGLAAAGVAPGTMTPPPTGVSPAGKTADPDSPSTVPPPGVVLPPLPGDAVAGVPGANPAPGAAATTATTVPAIVATATPPMPPRAEPRDERGHAETTAGAGFWIQLGAFKQRDGALDYQHRLLDEAPWLAPLMAVFADHGLNKLQAGPYRSRDDARSAAERVRATLQLVPTIVEKR